MRERVRVQVYSRQRGEQKHKIPGVLVVHRDYSPNSGWEIMGHESEIVNVWISFWEPATFIYIYVCIFKQQNPFYQLTFSSAKSSNWLELNAKSFGWRGSLMPNSVLHTHTHTYTHKHTDTHTGPGSPPRTQSLEGHGLEVLWWRQGFRKCFTGAGGVPLCSQRVTVLEWEEEPL